MFFESAFTLFTYRFNIMTVTTPTIAKKIRLLFVLLDAGGFCAAAVGNKLGVLYK
jgi:hypothetical protein